MTYKLGPVYEKYTCTLTLCFAVISIIWQISQIWIKVTLHGNMCRRYSSHKCCVWHLKKNSKMSKYTKQGWHFVCVYLSAKNLTGTKFYTGTVVSPSAPRTEQGLYWGYTVRLAPSFGAVFTQSPYKDGYDVTIGTSERGTMVDDLVLPNFRYI